MSAVDPDNTLRRRARSIGLQVRKFGATYEVRDANGTVLHSGTFDSADAYVWDRFGPARKGPRPGPRMAAPLAWAPMIDAFLITLSAAGQPATTINNRRQALGHMARELGGNPMQVTGEQLVNWLGSHTEWALETRRQRRTVARRFFLWA